MNQLKELFNDFNIIFSAGEPDFCQHKVKRIVKSCCLKEADSSVDLPVGELGYCHECDQSFEVIEICAECGREL